MSKVFGSLYLIVSRFGYPIVTSFLVLVGALLSGRDGYSAIEILILAALVGVAIVIWALFHARQSANVPDNAPALFANVRGSGKYAMLAFESEFCIASMSVGKRLAALETTYPDTFQLYSLSVFKSPGKELFEKYKGRTTPTFVLIDPDGEMVMNWPLILPIEHVSYEIQRKQPSIVQPQ